MPVDALPHPRGNITAEGRPGGGVMLRVHPNTALPLPETAYRSHFVTCPHAGLERASMRPRPPVVVEATRPPCPVCGMPVHEGLIALGDDRHVNCGDPQVAALFAAGSAAMVPSVSWGGVQC